MRMAISSRRMNAERSGNPGTAEPISADPARFCAAAGLSNHGGIPDQGYQVASWTLGFIAHHTPNAKPASSQDKPLPVCTRSSQTCHPAHPVRAHPSRMSLTRFQWSLVHRNRSGMQRISMCCPGATSARIDDPVPRRKSLSCPPCFALPRCVRCSLWPPASTCPSTPRSKTPSTGRSDLAAKPPGGLRGQVIKVTTLGASGPGSLRAAIEAKGPRIIVFEVGGIIDLDRQDLVIREPFVTIAGQTCPQARHHPDPRRHEDPHS